MSSSANENKAKVNDFLTKNHVGVIATSDLEGMPHAAAVYVVADQDLNIYFITKEKTVKHENLQKNPQASLVVYDASTQTTLQVSGRVTLDPDPQRFMNVFTQIVRVSMDISGGAAPPVSKLGAGEYHLFCIKSDKLRLAEYTKPEHGDFSDLFSVVDLTE